MASAPTTASLRQSARWALVALLVIEALAYGWLALRGLPASPRGFRIVLVATVALELLAAVALLTRWRRARTVARLAAAAQLGLGTAVAVLLALGAGYLRGVYGALGQGLGWLSLFLVAVVALVVIVPGLAIWIATARPTGGR